MASKMLHSKEKLLNLLKKKNECQRSSMINIKYSHSLRFLFPSLPLPPPLLEIRHEIVCAA